MFIKKKNFQHHSAFISKIDKRLSEFELTHELSDTQTTEKKNTNTSLNCVVKLFNSRKKNLFGIFNDV